MSKRIKSKPFWIVTAIILLIGVTFYTHKYKEGFEDKYNLVGVLYYGSLSDISNVSFVFASIIDASSDTSSGDIVWRTGNSPPESKDKKFYILLNATAVNVTKSDFLILEKEAIKNLKGVVCGVVKDSSGDYLDIKGNKIIGNYINILGLNLLKSTFYWILGGIGVVVSFIIFMYMRTSGSSARYNNRY